MSRSQQRCNALKLRFFSRYTKHASVIQVIRINSWILSTPVCWKVHFGVDRRVWVLTFLTWMSYYMYIHPPNHNVSFSSNQCRNKPTICRDYWYQRGMFSIHANTKRVKLMPMHTVTMYLACSCSTFQEV